MCHRTNRRVAWNLTIHKAIYKLNTIITTSTRCSSWFRHCATSRKVSASIPDGINRIFHWQSYRPHYGPWVDSASNRNEYQEYFLGVKAAGAYGWQPYPPHVPTVLKSGTLTVFITERECVYWAVRAVSLNLLWRLVAGLSPRRPRFDSKSVPVRFMVDKVALRQDFLPVVMFSPSVSFQQRSTLIFIYMLLLPEEPKKECSLGKREALDRNIVPLFIP